MSHASDKSLAAAGLEVVSDIRCDIGEGPTWDAATRTLLWVDIYAKLVHRLFPRTGAVGTVAMPQKVGAVVPTDDGRILLALEDGFWLAGPDGAAPERWVAVDGLPAGARFNDGKCDRAGSFLAGSVTADHRPGAGALHRVDGRGVTTMLVDGVTLSNGLAFAPDGATLYYIDTKARTVRAFDYEPTGGPLGAGRVVLEAPDAGGTLDGMTVDAEGSLWIAFFGGGCVRCYSPDGRLRATIELPVRLATSCAFGGDDLGDLYITSGSKGIDPADEPLAGMTFRCRPGVRGIAESPFVRRP